MTDTEQAPPSEESSLLQRWSQSLVDALQAQERCWLIALEKYDAVRLDQGVRAVETGQVLTALREQHTFESLKCNTMDQFCDAYRGIGARHARRLMAVGEAFTAEQLHGKVHCLATLTAILPAKSEDDDNDEYFQALIDHGSGHPASKITSALRWAKMCESVPLGLAVIAYLLSDGPRPAEMDELEELEGAERLFAEVQRALQRAIEGEAELKQMLADPDLPGERRVQLVTLCSEVWATMARLGFTPEAAGPAPWPAPVRQKPGPKEAGPRTHTVRVSPDGAVSTVSDGSPDAVRPDPGAPGPHQPGSAAEAGGSIPPQQERRSPDRVEQTETPEQRNLRLCAEHQPAPFLVSVFDLDVPPEWPEDWEQRWLETPAGRDPILLCADGPSPQRGTLGRTIFGAWRVSLNLNGSFCGLLVSTPGGGKTYAGNVVTHMAVARLPNVNELPSPLCALMPHYHADDSHEPELLSMRFPNRSQREVSYLVEEVGSLPAGHEDIVVVCFPERVERMRQRHPHVQVYPLLLASWELTTSEIEAILGIGDPNDDRLYVRQLRQALRGSAPGSLDEVERRLLSIKELMPEGRRLVKARVALFRPSICDDFPLGRLRRPGRVIIVDGRDPTRSKDDALMMMHVALSVLMRREPGEEFQMLLRVDELHEFVKHKEFVAWLLMVSRKRRHLGVSLLCSTQFGQLVPGELVANSDLILIGRTQAEEALRHLGKFKAALNKLKIEVAARQNDGEMIAWVEKVYVDPAAAAAEVGELPELLELQVRSQNAHHGGATRCAVPQKEGDDDAAEE